MVFLSYEYRLWVGGVYGEMNCVLDWDYFLFIPFSKLIGLGFTAASGLIIEVVSKLFMVGFELQAL